MSQSVLGGRYRIEARIGAGGMAEVFRGFDTVLDRPVAIKILAPQYAKDPSFVDRFRREAQAAARLNHPNVVGVYDTGSDDGTHYIVMEFVEGRTLADFLSKGGRLTPVRAVEVTEHVCDALTAAHAQGVIHRDVKSANIMVTRSGTVKVMDFGIARIAEGAETVAQTAAVLGTASYLSPEQAQGKPVDTRSDLYSLGVVLYEMLTGGPPFTGDTAVAVAYKHVQETPPPPSSSNPAVSAQMDAVAMRALAKNPANRYQSAAEFKEDLERVRKGEQVRATPLLPAGDATQVIKRANTQAMPPVPEEPHKTNPWLVGLIGLLILAVLAGGLFLLGSSLLSSNPTASPTPTKAIPSDLVGQQVDAAKTELTALGFTNVVPQAQATDLKPPGTVLQVQPPSGTLPISSQITLIYAKAPQVAVPDVTNHTVSDARSILRAQNLTLVVQTQQTSDTVEAGKIISQSPLPDAKVKSGSTVQVIVSTGKAMVTLPDVRCYSFSHASNVLRSAGLNPIISSDTVPANPACPNGNKVAGQDPDPSTVSQVPAGSDVTLFPGEVASPSESPSP